MTGFFISIAICIALIFIERQVTLTLLANAIIGAEDFEEFIHSMINIIYALIVATLGVWFFFGEASVYFSFYALITCVTMFRVDLDNIEAQFEKLKALSDNSRL